VSGSRFDVIWAERDTSSGIDVLDSLAQKDLKDVPAFSRSTATCGKSSTTDGCCGIDQEPAGGLGYYFNAEDNAVRAMPPDPVIPKERSPADIASCSGGLHGNLPIYQKHAAAAGHFQPRVERTTGFRGACRCLLGRGAYYDPRPWRWSHYLALKTGKFPKSSPASRRSATCRGPTAAGMAQGGPLTIRSTRLRVP